jgi:hypothetical protein
MDRIMGIDDAMKSERQSDEQAANFDAEMNKLLVEQFSGPQGRLVLGWLLNEMYFFSRCENDAQMALRNFAVGLCNRLNLGVSRSDTIKNVVSVLVNPAHANMKREGEGNVGT